MENRKIIFMTGATSGLGMVSALKAVNKGDTLIILARNKVSSSALTSAYTQLNAMGKIEIIEGNLNSFESIYSACQEVKSKYPVIDMIVNNAGIMNFEWKKSVDNIEETLQVNLLSHVLICHLLLENLTKSIDPKIIFTSSALHQGQIMFENLEFKNSFSSFKVYRQSKLGVILICRLLAKKLKHDNVSIYSQHPGMVRTNLGRSAGWFSNMIFYILGKSAEKGAQTLSYLIENHSENLSSGEYYANKKITVTTKESYDMEVAEKLLTVIKAYLKPYLKTESSIFNEFHG
jgi:NAD(P)-dependent dehydrogenase (short-subunit alcohol dehydrogenase family)